MKQSKFDVTHITYSNAKLPHSFDGFRVALIADLHIRKMKKSYQELFEHIAEVHPNIIAIAGDWMDSTLKNIQIALSTITHIVNIAPVYFVSGNNEFKSGLMDEFVERIKEIGVVIVDDHSAVLEKNDEKLILFGIADPTFSSDDAFAQQLILKSLSLQSDFNILLTHRPEKIDLYRHCHIDLALTGHAHGGQFRLPLIGGLYAPHQGIFPKYTSGLYKKGQTAMVVSRGLGNSGFPFRLFNRPELVVVTLKI